MTPAGMAVVEAAKAIGTWSALVRVEGGVEPDALTAALDAMPSTRQEWNAFSRSAAAPSWSGSTAPSDRKPGHVGWPP